MKSCPNKQWLFKQASKVQTQSLTAGDPKQGFQPSLADGINQRFISFGCGTA